MLGQGKGERKSAGAKALFGMAPEELRSVVEGLGLPRYRAVQLGDALYKQRVGSIEEVTTLPIEVRERLTTEGYGVGLPEIVQAAKSVDGTERYLVRLADGETVETVWMPGGDGGERGDGSDAAVEEEGEGDADLGGGPTHHDKAVMNGAQGLSVAQGVSGAKGKDKYGGSSPAAQNDKLRGEGLVAGADGYKRATICISSQVGCAVNCQFCLTAKLGIRRNLTAGEIAGQVAAVLNRQRVRIGSGKGVETPSRINLVFMGMGEPFLNYDAFMQSVHVLRAMGIPESRMTVSTSGIEPSIRRFAEEPVRPKLALSLNASNDVVRREIMPITKKWDIAALLAAVGSIPLGKREYVTFEYVLLGGVNDQPEHAREVLALLKGMKAKVNLIVWNPGPGIDYHQPKPEDVAVFHRMLIDGGIPTFTRRPRGRDIFAACGQLKRTVEPGLVEIAAVGQ
ncbi:MAG: 23S rRNA (adenine(2503)-C(2))-methyltransferase RlmN [Acidobacteriota bacterium]|nr:23S rRNA (adenine(2503)-C(2))-methyltransferase RlmN [Acidobacteriota bacterium]